MHLSNLILSILTSFGQRTVAFRLRVREFLRFLYDEIEEGSLTFNHQQSLCSGVHVEKCDQVVEVLRWHQSKEKKETLVAEANKQW